MRDLTTREIVRLAGGLATTNRLLKRTPTWTPDRMRAWQWERISALVQHAVAHVPFYRELYRSVGFEAGDLNSWDDFARLPVVTKDQVIAAYPDRIVSDDVDRDQLIVSRSSGSSGKVLDIAYGPDAMNTYVLAGLRLYRMGFRYRPWHKQVYVYTSPYPLNSLLGLFKLVFVPTLTPIPELIAVLRRERPDLLVCYPSHLKAILDEMSAADFAAIRPKCVSVNSEMSTQAERDAMSERLGCPVLDEYSSEELTRIAAQCRSKRYHVFEDINYLETLDDSDRPVLGELGRIVGTNLHNFAMPMIRYRQDDLAVIDPPTRASCSCGWQFRTLRDLQGRRNDSFVLPSGRTLTSGFLLDVTYDFLLTHRGAVRDFCLIQEAKDRIVLQLVPGDGLTPAIETQIRERFVAFLEPSVAFQIDRVAVCEKTLTGKRNPIINKMNRAAAHAATSP